MNLLKLIQKGKKVEKTFFQTGAYSCSHCWQVSLGLFKVKQLQEHIFVTHVFINDMNLYECTFRNTNPTLASIGLFVQ